MMCKSIFLLILGCSAILAACKPGNAGLPEVGVSRELARQRKAEVKDLQYQLQFVIPAEKTQSVKGEVQLLFSLEHVTDVVLDFRGKPEQIGEVRLNDEQVDARVVNEHIIVPGVSGENKIDIKFIADDQSLNRNDEYLYTLLVPDRARTLFPCFDQPDLKGRFHLTLEIPENWVAVANGPLKQENTGQGRKKMIFEETQPLSTYLFSFVAGKWSQLEKNKGERKVTLYYRETEPSKLAQADVIFEQVFEALEWMEEYTGIAYPYAKYDLVIVPGFQFGGMEHPGAVLYNDKRMFLSEHPTVKEQLGRMELISHETAHMWFGDYVTMEWFNDVWTKEVFANYFAARMCEPRFPEVNHQLNALGSFYPAAYSEDRTLGTNAIRQSLDNLHSAGLIYGQIVYNKAPVVMSKLVDWMGKENFRNGLQEYLHTYAYSNATWDDLIGIMGKYTDEDPDAWSRVWIDEKGMPEISAYWKDGLLTIRQQDAWRRGLVWPQKLKYSLIRKPASDGKQYPAEIVEVTLKDSLTVLEIREPVDVILPNVDGKGYGYFLLDEPSARYGLDHIGECGDPVLRFALGMTLYENQLRGQIEAGDFIRTMLRLAENEQEPLIVSAVIGQVKNVCLRGQLGKQPETEKVLQRLSALPGNIERQQLSFRVLLDVWTLPEISEEIYRIWKMQKLFQGFPLSENDFMKMAYELAIRMPERYEEIVTCQSEMITNPDRKKEFHFIVRAVHPEQTVRDSLFGTLLKAENRRVEPWVAQVVYYLNHPLRESGSLKYILPALEELPGIQRTGDIFFPRNWVDATLRGHHSPEAAEIVNTFLQKHPDFPPLLKNKILQSADHLFRTGIN